jgi:hypothetical protein
MTRILLTTARNSDDEHSDHTPGEHAPTRREGVLVTGTLRTFGLLACKGCGATHPGGAARCLLLEERDFSETLWTLGHVGDGSTSTDEVGGSMAGCPANQSNALVRALRFATEGEGALPAAPKLPR